MIIDLPPHIERVIIQQAQIQGISISELISQKFSQVNLIEQDTIESSPDMLVTDFFKQFSSNQVFQNIDPVEYQREIRNKE